MSFIWRQKKRRTFTSQKPWIRLLMCACVRCVTFYKTTHCGLLFIRSGVWDRNLNGCANNNDVEIGHLECCTIGWCCYSPKMVLTTTHISISWRNQLWIHRFWQHVREQPARVCDDAKNWILFESIEEKEKLLNAVVALSFHFYTHLQMIGAYTEWT